MYINECMYICVWINAWMGRKTSEREKKRRRRNGIKEEVKDVIEEKQRMRTRRGGGLTWADEPEDKLLPLTNKLNQRTLRVKGAATLKFISPPVSKKCTSTRAN